MFSLFFFKHFIVFFTQSDNKWNKLKNLTNALKSQIIAMMKKNHQAEKTMNYIRLELDML